MRSVEGVLLGIGLFPVKSVEGLRPDRAEVGPDGLRHDRGFVLRGADGGVLTARTTPALRDLVLRGDPGAPVVTTRDGAPLDRVLGSGVRLEPQPGGARQVAPVHVVSRVQRAAPDAGDSSRANLVLDLGEDEPGPGDLVGARLHVGAVVLLLERSPRHCAGLLASVLVPGPLAVGDAVRLTGPAAAPG